MLPWESGEYGAGASPSNLSRQSSSTWISEGKDSVGSDSLEQPDPSNAEASLTMGIEETPIRRDAPEHVECEFTGDDKSAIVCVRLLSAQVCSRPKSTYYTSTDTDEQPPEASNPRPAGVLFKIYSCFLCASFILAYFHVIWPCCRLDR